MHLLLAPDSYKDALSANEAAAAIQRGMKAASSAFTFTLMPLADGGEGTSQILCTALGAKWVSAPCLDALLRPSMGHYAWLPPKKLAIIELAQAVGIQGLRREERDPLRTSTYGLGMLMADALKRGARAIYLTLGGSATHDAGTGMLAALGFDFFAEGKNIPHPTGADLERITRVSVPPGLPHFDCTVLCDVQHQLTGPQGAAHTFARQKGANEASIAQLEAGTLHFASMADGHAGRSLSHTPGTGAAGGTGYGAMAYLKARLRKGADEVLHITDFNKALAQADVVITGEGRFDGQTEHGKLISAIAARCTHMATPLFVLCGEAAGGLALQRRMGITAVWPMGNGARTIEDCLASAGADLERLAYQLGSTFKACRALK